jgi:glutathione synthase/RimK-type ligase-like ATP-grasp enzyme
VKFYGVTGTSYFDVAQAWNAADGLVAARLRDAAQDAAAALGLEVCGGDAIVSGGQFKIVDFNDWPSFERVRAQAAHAIAGRILQLRRS